MMEIVSLVIFSSETVLSLELFLHSLLEGTDFFIPIYLKMMKTEKNQFSFSTGEPGKDSFAKIQIDTLFSTHHKMHKRTPFKAHF